MNIRIVDTETDLDSLQESWNQLSEETASSLFSSYDYVRTAWEHFHQPDDRLFVLVLSEGSSITGIAPFYVTWTRKLGLPYRVIRFIAMWEGDRPVIISREGSEHACWIEIIRFLARRDHSWEALDLSEQPVEGPEGKGWQFISEAGLFWENAPDAVDYYIFLDGAWENYLTALPGHARQNLRRQIRRLSSLPGGFQVERITEPDRIGEALVRFQAIEQAGWKAEAGIGLAKNEHHRAFYDDLIGRLAARQQVAAYFLRNGATDMAGTVNFIKGKVMYGRHTAYLPEHATFSPGIVLHAEIIRELFSGPYHEFDLLALREDGTSQKHKTDWATGRRETVRWMGYRMYSRILPLVAAKYLKRLTEKTGRDLGCRAEG